MPKPYILIKPTNAGTKSTASSSASTSILPLKASTSRVVGTEFEDEEDEVTQRTFLFGKHEQVQAQT
jgi:hypothetical protein